jgi:TIR domain
MSGPHEAAMGGPHVRLCLAQSSTVNDNFSSCNLVWATFVATSLRKAKFTDAKLGSTTFNAIDLSVANGLGTAKHESPSFIAFDTIHESGGKIPVAFLRGCGAQDTLIEYARALISQRTQYYSAFISYSSEDDEIAKRIHSDLQANGVRVWFAPEALKIGDKFRQEIDHAIRIYDKLIVILSHNSINSSWVEKEVESAFEKERRENRIVLFPIRLDDAVMQTSQAWAADVRRARHIGDFRKWKVPDEYQKAFERLLRDLKAKKAKAGHTDRRVLHHGKP